MMCSIQLLPSLDKKGHAAFQIYCNVHRAAAAEEEEDFMDWMIYVSCLECPPNEQHTTQHGVPGPLAASSLIVLPYEQRPNPTQLHVESGRSTNSLEQKLRNMFGGSDDGVSECDKLLQELSWKLKLIRQTTS